MKKLIALTGFMVFLCFIFHLNSHAQAYIQYSHLDNNNSYNDMVKVVNGEAYVLQVPGPSASDTTKLKKYAVDGSLLYSRNILAVTHLGVMAMDIVNGEVYLLAGGGLSIEAIKLSADGSVAFDRIISDTTSTSITNPRCEVSREIIINGNEWMISALVSGLNFPTTMGGMIQDYNYLNLYIAKLDATTGEITRSMAIPDGVQPCCGLDNSNKIFVENGYLYAALSAENSNLPVTIGNLPASGGGFATHVYVRKMNLSDFSPVFSRYLSVDSLSTIQDFLVKNGEYHITGTFSDQTAFYTKLYADGSLALTKSLSIPPWSISSDRIKITANHVYIFGNSWNSIGQVGVFAFKLNVDGSTVYIKNNPTSISWSPYQKMPIELVGEDLYMAGTGAAANYPVTNNSTWVGQFTGYITHYDPSGNIVFSSFTNQVYKMEIQNNKIYLAGYGGQPIIPSTDSSQVNGPGDCFVTVLKPDGTTVYNGYFGGSQSEYIGDFDVDDGSVFMTGSSSSTDFLTTEPTALQNMTNGDPFITKISFCPDRYNTSDDTLSPAIQTVCKYGLAQIISGRDLVVPGDSLPLVYANAVPTLQRPVKDIHYQWQKSLSLSGPWINIQDATERDFRPVIGTLNEYFRRQSFLSSGCNGALIHTSDTATVIAGPLTAPIIDFDSPLITCPSSPVQLHGTTAVTGGQAPYTYSWDMGLPSIANPVVAPLVNTVYTLLLTDMAGCQQLGQVVVSAYKANAGPDKRNCGFLPVRIGTAPSPATSTTSYAWTPTAGLDAGNIAQPMANPASATDYILTVNLTKSDGSICITHDTVNVRPVAGPVTPLFAGADKVICNRDSAMVGTPAEPGFNYSWTPANYITQSNSSQTYYYASPPIHQMPYPGPAILYVYAKKDGCTFSDTVIVTIIEADAGEPLCHPGIIGLPDRTPGVAELYSWTLVSGPGNFLGTTNAPQVPVSGSVGSSSVYELTVSYNGKTCQSGTVVFEECLPGSGTPTDCSIHAIPSDSCVSFAANGGHVTLIGSSPITDGIYTWEPHVGLSAYTGNTVQLTDNTPRLYTLTVVSAHDSSLRCTASITTNPGLPVPVFAAHDTTTCANVPLMIGAPNVAGNTYEWEGNGLSDYHTSDPVATVDYTSFFYVTITNARGCKLTDTILVTVPNTLADAGGDRLVCGNAIVTLGTDSLPNTTYSWDPPASSWQSGTNQFSANPQVLSAVTVTYTLTTITAGCPSSDEVNITVNNSPVIADAPDRTLCAGAGYTVSIGSQPIAGVTYLWSPVTGLDDPTSSMTYASPATNTTYTLTATFPGNCAVPATDQVTVTVSNPAFDMPDIHFCPENGAIALGANAPVGMSYYQWNPYGLLTSAHIANPSTLDPPPQTTTVFTLYIQNQSGCGYIDTLTLIPYTEAPFAGADRTACKDQPINIGSAANVTGPSIVYSWNPATNLNDPSNPNPVFTATTAGTFQYVLTKTDNSVSCTVNDAVVITVVDILPTLNAPTVCRNSCVQIGTTAITGIDYQWTPVNGLSNASVSNPTACIDTASTVYTLTVSDQSGCTASTAVVIGVNPVPGVQASVPGITACVGDNNVMLVPSLPPGSYSYLWSPDDGTLSDINIANPVVQTIVSGTTQFGLQITDNTTGCTNTFTTNVTVNNCSPYAQTGNFVWFDTNENGIQDPGELGVSGVIVKLYNNLDFNFATTVTDANGNYDFPGVSPGNDYYVVFTKPVGYDFTIQNAGGINAQNNSKADVNGRTNAFDLITGVFLDNIDAGIKSSGSVPVTLLNFNAVLHSNRQVYVDWQTTAEYNNDHFDVERSIDAVNFIKIGTVGGHGTTALPHNYASIDPHPVTGINYYRLRQVDFDGNSAYSRIVPIELTNEEISKVYYDNTDNVIRVIFNKSQSNMHLKLFAADGKLVRSVSANNVVEYKLLLPVLARGIYIVQLTDEKSTYSKKIFISR